MECAYNFKVDGTWNVPTIFRWTAHGMCLLLSGGRHMECAYYFKVDGTWNVPTYYFDFCRLCLAKTQGSVEVRCTHLYRLARTFRRLECFAASTCKRYDPRNPSHSKFYSLGKAY